MASPSSPNKNGLAASIIAGGLLSSASIILIGASIALVIAAVISVGSAFLRLANLAGGENQTNAGLIDNLGAPPLADRAAAAICLNQWIDKKSGGKSPLKTLGVNFITAATDQAQAQEGYAYNPALLVAIASMETSLALPPNRTIMDFNGVYAHNPFNITVANPKTEQNIHLQDRYFKVFGSFEDSIAYAGPYLARVYFKKGITDLNSLEMKYCGDPASNKLCVPWLNNVRDALSEITTDCPQLVSAVPRALPGIGKLTAPLGKSEPQPRTHTDHSFYINRGQGDASGGDLPVSTGTPVYAIADGTAKATGLLRQHGAGRCQGQIVGQGIDFRSDDGRYHAYYAHVTTAGVIPANASGVYRVARGTQLAAIYAHPCGSHLHFELQDGGQAVSCTKYDLYFGLPNRGCHGA